MNSSKQNKISVSSVPPCEAKKYEAFGNLLWSSGSFNDNREFTSKEKDPTGFHYFGARYYYGNIGRFLSPDPHTIMPGNIDLSNPQELNPYVYCVNDPLKFYDPDGKRAYFINGINYNKDVNDYGADFVGHMGEQGIQNPVQLTRLFTGNAMINLAAAYGEKIGRPDALSSKMTSEMQQNLKSTPLEKGEQVNIIGYSGGGYVALRAAMKLLEGGQQVDNVVVLGTPKMPFLRVNENSKIVMELKKKGVNVIFPECDHDKFSSQDEMIEQKEQYKDIYWIQQYGIR